MVKSIKKKIYNQNHLNERAEKKKVEFKYEKRACMLDGCANIYANENVLLLKYFNEMV